MSIEDNIWIGIAILASVGAVIWTIWKARIDMTGKRYGRLVALSPIGTGWNETKAVTTPLRVR